MNAHTTPIQGLLVLAPKRFQDERGWFMESFNDSRFNEALVEHGQDKVRFVQDNQSLSRQGVLRGLHYQINPFAQGKLVRVLSGTIWDVAVDLRIDSPTRGKWFGLEISADNFLQLWIPKGFAHGFLTMSPSAQVLYKATAYYAPAAERSLLWNDARLNIEWPLSALNIDTPILNQKDSIAPAYSAMT